MSSSAKRSKQASSAVAQQGNGEGEKAQNEGTAEGSGNFMVRLWESVFAAQPTPTLVQATHFTFLSLVVVLFFMAYATRSIHAKIMCVIASLFWAAVTWFLKELQQAGQLEPMTRDQTKKE